MPAHADSAPSAREFILDFLAIVGQPMSVSTLTRAGDILEFKPVAIRVALTRLASEKFIESDLRGVWRLSGIGPWGKERTRWRRVPSLVKPWAGNWLLALADDIERADRVTRRTTERALEHRGFRKVRGDLFLRPDNLALLRAELKEDLVSLGASPKTNLVVAREIDFAQVPRLWDVKRQAKELATVRQQMERLSRIDPSSRKDYCRRSWYLGRQAVRMVNNDPLLPKEMADWCDLLAVIQHLPEFITQGAQEWRSRLGLDADAASGASQG